MSVQARDAEHGGDWYEPVSGLECVLIEEEEDHVKAVMLEHPRAHLGWALDVVDPSGLRIQLHTPEVISADDEWA